jgi:hypothetical protein
MCNPLSKQEQGIEGRYLQWVTSESMQWWLQSLRGSPHCAAVTRRRIRPHGHRTGMLPAKAGCSFAVREVFPAFRFAEPFPAVLDIERRALATQ